MRTIKMALKKSQKLDTISTNKISADIFHHLISRSQIANVLSFSGFYFFIFFTRNQPMNGGAIESTVNFQPMHRIEIHFNPDNMDSTCVFVQCYAPSLQPPPSSRPSPTFLFIIVLLNPSKRERKINKKIKDSKKKMIKIIKINSIKITNRKIPQPSTLSLF